MSQSKCYQVITNEKCLHATAEDFEQLFAKGMADMLRLSLHLTADAEKAESCLILAMRDCFFGGSVPNDRVQTWARRMLIRNAIRLVWGTPTEILGESALEFQLQPNDLPLEALRKSDAILTLPDLDRLAFVICVLERYSILDCACFLRRSPRQVQDAIERAISQVLSLEEPTDTETAATLRGDIDGNS